LNYTKNARKLIAGLPSWVRDAV